MASTTRPQSSAVWHIGPGLSSVHERGIPPARLTRPYVGLRPAIPQLDEGVMIDPHVSEPMAKGASPALTAEPDPLDEPPRPGRAAPGVDARPGEGRVRLLVADAARDLD